MTYPITAPASGSYPISTSWTPTGTFANTDQNNASGVGNYGWGGVDSTTAGARCMTTGSETYTIVSGNVTTIAGTTIDGISVAVNDVVLIPTAPAATGTGTAVSSGVGSNQPGNGLYYVTAVATNITVARAATMSSTSAQANPAGRRVFVRAGTANGFTMWAVSSPSGVAAFTYGTTAMTWKNQLVSQTITSPTISGTVSGSPTITTPTISSPTITGTGIPNVAIQQAGINNFNTAVQSQVVVSATAYYVTSSGLTMPASALNGMTVNKTCLIWRVAMAKTAAGTGTFQLIIYRGTNGSTSDTADVTQTIGTQTAVVDDLLVDVKLIVTTTGATGAYFWSMTPVNSASAIGTPAGFGVTRGTTSAWFTGTVSSVAMNTASLIFGLGFKATTGTPTITVPMVQAKAFNMN